MQQDFNWREKLKKLCLQIPLNITINEVKEEVRTYLNLREMKIKCNICGKMFLAHNKSTLDHPTCPECKKRKKEKKEKQEKVRHLEWEKIQNLRENKKIDNFNKGCGNTPACDFWLLKDNLEEEQIEILKEMDYSEFLKTKYWKIISRYMKYKNNKCSLCGSKINLRTHHKSYIHRGEEINYLEDLIVLCDECHKKFHDIGDK